MNTVLTSLLCLFFLVSTAWGQGFPNPGPGVPPASATADATPPATPTGLAGVAGSTYVDLTWSHSNPGDVDVYIVNYRCPSGSGPYSVGAQSLVRSARVSGLTNGVECDFQVSANDTAANAGSFTAAIQVTPTGPVGGISGVESACTTSGLYGSGGNCVCSEMLNEPFTNSGDFSDLPGSPDTHECWGTARWANSWLGIQSGVTISTASNSSLTGWGTVEYSLSQTSPNVWAMAPIDSVTSSTRTWCIKFFRQYIGPQHSDASCRLKVAQINHNPNDYGYTFNPQLKSDGTTCSVSPKNHQLTVGVPNDANLDNSIATDQCDDKPCKFELCVDGNVLAGTNLQGRFRMTSYEGAGEVSTVTSAVINGNGVLSDQDVTGGDWWHSGGGSEEMRNGMFSVWAWDTDTDQWPPNTEEIEP